MGADLEPLGVSQRCQGQQTSVSIQHLPLLLLLSLHSLRSSTQHCHKTITTQYRERKTHTRQLRVCVFECCARECTQTHPKSCVRAYIHTHMHGYFWYKQGAFHAIKLLSPCTKCSLAARITDPQWMLIKGSSLFKRSAIFNTRMSQMCVDCTTYYHKFTVHPRKRCVENCTSY